MPYGASTAIIGLPRWTDETTFSLGTSAPGYPVGNLGGLPLTQVWRSADANADSTWFLATMDRPRGVRLLALVGHNLSINARARIRLSYQDEQAFTADPGTDACACGAGHGLTAGNAVAVNSGGAMPGGLAPRGAYFVSVPSPTTFKLHTSQADALAGTNVVDITSAGTGTHTVLGRIVYDSGIEDVWPVVFGTGDLEWEDDNWWTGKYSEIALEGRTWNRPFYLGFNHLCRTILVEIVDPGNAAGHVQVGMCEIAQGWPLGVNFDWGAKYGHRFRTLTSEAFGGAKYFTRRNKPRVFQGAVSSMNRDEALTRMFDGFDQADLDTPFLWFPHPDEPLHWLRNTYLARLTDPGLFSYANFDADGVPLSLEEVIS